MLQGFLKLLGSFDRCCRGVVYGFERHKAFLLVGFKRFYWVFGFGVLGLLAWGIRALVLGLMV